MTAPHTDFRAPLLHSQDMRGRIIRGVARTAVVAGTATAVSRKVSNNMDKNEAERAAVAQQEAQQAQQQATAPVTNNKDLSTKLMELNKLKESGVLTEAEFQNAKAKVLSES